MLVSSVMEMARLVPSSDPSQDWSSWPNVSVTGLRNMLCSLCHGRWFLVLLRVQRSPRIDRGAGGRRPGSLRGVRLRSLGRLLRGCCDREVLQDLFGVGLELLTGRTDQALGLRRSQ